MWPKVETDAIAISSKMATHCCVIYERQELKDLDVREQHRQLDERASREAVRR